MKASWRFDNSYARLPALFYARLAPTPVCAPRLLVLNRPLAERLGLDASALSGPEGAEIFSGNRLPEGSEPIAQAYAGHQFGHANMLGDGRAHLLGELLAPDGTRFDLQLKGSGQTPFSRRGDGRAALGPMLREHILSEAMHALGIPTTRSLAVATTGEPVFREEPLPGAVLARVAASHLRVGTFEYAASRGPEALRTLADYAIERHYPELAAAPGKYHAFLRAVAERQASLIARWMQVGFVHGVMNTDNVAISGETIDYGPCAFLEAYSPAAVFSSIDRHGRYAYGNQPRIGAWNLARFAEALLPLLHEEEASAAALAREAIEEFGFRYEAHWLSGMRAKLGLLTEEAEDEALLASLLSCMERLRADFTGTFRALAEENLPPGGALLSDGLFRDWLARWEARLSRQPAPREEALRLMRASSPAVIARNHRVEEALAAAVAGDLSVMEELLAALARPFEGSPAQAPYREPDPKAGEGYRTFCGT